MARSGYDAALKAEIATGRFRPIILVEGNFVSGVARMHSSVGLLNWNGHTWYGMGHFGSIDPVTETGEVAAGNVVLSLTGIPKTLPQDGGPDLNVLVSVLDEIRPNQKVKIWFGALTEARAIIGSPYQIFGGRMDVGNVVDGADSCTITISVESRLVDLTSPRLSNYTHEDQQRFSAGDKGFEYVPQLQEWNGTWGKAGAAVPGWGGGGGGGGGNGDGPPTEDVK